MGYKLEYHILVLPNIITRYSVLILMRFYCTCVCACVPACICVCMYVYIFLSFAAEVVYSTYYNFTGQTHTYHQIP